MNVHALLAVGVNSEGYREILGLHVTTAEDGAGWLGFFRDLAARGLSGVALVTSDAHRGLVEAIGAALPGASWQRCRTHYAANLMAATVVLEPNPRPLLSTRREIVRLDRIPANPSSSLPGCGARHCATVRTSSHRSGCPESAAVSRRNYKLGTRPAEIVHTEILCRGGRRMAATCDPRPP